MCQAGGDFPLKAPCDIDLGVGDTAREQPDVAHGMRFEAVGEMLRECEVIAGKRVDGVERGASDGAMVRVANVSR